MATLMLTQHKALISKSMIRLLTVAGIFILMFITGNPVLAVEFNHVTDPDSLKEDIPKPRLELGIGRMAFYGDVGNNLQNYSPLNSNVGAFIRVGAPLTRYLDFDMQVLYGSLSMTETTGNRNLNFHSQIRLMGAGLTYNFDHLLKPNHIVAPYVSVGIAGFEFLSKTDLYDANGNKYHYWSDGSIRNISESASNANAAIEIQRDYKYETDIRKLNADGFGDYQERSWAIPVGIGATMKLGDHMKFRLGTEMYFTFTNYIDGITEESTGNRKGNGSNDRFLFTTASLSYDLHMKGSGGKTKSSTSDWFDASEYPDLLMEDEDDDGVADIVDLCPGTPFGVRVNEFGCPVDKDGDGVPDHLDDEPNTAKGAFVDADGVTISDNDFLQAYLFWTDSINILQYDRSRIETASLPENKGTSRKKPLAYYVQVEEGVELSSEMIERILSIPDVKTVDQDGKTLYIIGNYSDLVKAVERKINLEADGIMGIVVADQDGRVIDYTAESQTIETDLKKITTVDADYEDKLNAPTEDVVYRVQIGAFQNPLNKDVFTNVRDIIMIKGEDGLTRYVSGSFTNLEAAANRKVDLLLSGFEGAFITAYRSGKRITLTEAGVIVSGADSKTQEVASPAFDASKVKFRVQIAAYQDEVPTEMLDKFISLGKVKPVRAAGVTTRYVHGEFNSYDEALKVRNGLLDKGFPDAFVVGDFNGQIISAQEAQEMMK
jgi:hypothetical protein